jgi:hypothetical protein
MHDTEARRGLFAGIRHSQTTAIDPLRPDEQPKSSH